MARLCCMERENLRDSRIAASHTPQREIEARGINKKLARTKGNN